MVNGKFPTIDVSLFSDSLRPTQRFLSVAEIESSHKEQIKKGTYKLNSGGADQMQLQKVLDASMKDQGKTGENKEEFFQGKGISLSSNSNPGKYLNVHNNEELQIMKLSFLDVNF